MLPFPPFSCSLLVLHFISTLLGPLPALGIDDGGGLAGPCMPRESHISWSPGAWPCGLYMWRMLLSRDLTLEQSCTHSGKSGVWFAPYKIEHRWLAEWGVSHFLESSCMLYCVVSPTVCYVGPIMCCVNPAGCCKCPTVHDAGPTECIRSPTERCENPTVLL